MGSTLAKYAAEGVEISLLTATRGERGWQGDADANPGLEQLGQIRTKELLDAARVLDIRQVEFLGYIDGEVDQADPEAVIHAIVAAVRRIRPQVVVTFGPDGSYGHPDHIAICQFTTAALVAAADPAYTVATDTQPELPPHRVAKLYYLIDSKEEVALYDRLFGSISMTVDGEVRYPPGWDTWAITTRIDADDHWQTALRAILCHRTQIGGFGDMEQIADEHHRTLIGVRHYYRAFSLVNGGREVEDDLFAGVR
jgi:LmbE family N-acetylglucosaminyl deacetylase